MPSRRRLQVVILIGLQGSGKSTFARKRFVDSHAHVSRDLFRHHRKPSRRQAELIDEALRGGRSVVVDNTNPTPADRAAIIEIARRHNAKVIGYFFEPDVKQSIRRNAERTGHQRVPNVAIFTTMKRLQPPTHDEGFDRLYHVRSDERGSFSVRKWNENRTPRTAG